MSNRKYLKCNMLFVLFFFLRLFFFQAKRIVNRSNDANHENRKLYNSWAKNFVRYCKDYKLVHGHCLDVQRLKACTRFNLGPYFVSLALHFSDERGKLRFKKFNTWNSEESNIQLRKKESKNC
jgi:hypothetical protein